MKQLIVLTKQKLCEKKGFSYIDLVVMILGVTMAIAFAITAGGTITRFFQVNSAAHGVMRIIEVDGKYDSEEQAKIQNYLSSCNVSATVSCTESGNIPLNEKFTVNLVGKSFIRIGGIAQVEIPVPASATGHGEVYWKD